MQITDVVGAAPAAMLPVIVNAAVVTVAFSAGDVTAIVGSDLSRLTVTLALALPPGPVTVRSKTWLAPSVETTIGAGQLLVFVHVNVIVTSDRFQPAAFGSGVTAAVIVGAGGR